VSTIEEALVARLAAVAEVTALVTSRVYPVRAPQGAIMPCITYQRISAPQRDANFGADTGIAWPRFQITGWASQYSEAKTLGTAIRHAFQRYRGTLLGVEILDGVIEMDEDIRDDAAQLWGAATDVTLKHRET
jgi:hypothetical protein